MILRHMIDIDETLKLTQSQGQGSRSIPAGKHFWKYKNVHLYQTGATDIFTRRKCPCFYKNQYFFAEAQLFLIFRPFETQIVLYLFLIFEAPRKNLSVLTIFHTM